MLRGLEEELKELNSGRARDMARMSEIHERLDEHDSAIREMRESTLAARRTALNVETLSLKVDGLSATVTQAVDTFAQSAQQSAIRTVKAARTEAEQDLRIIELDAQMRQAGITAGKRAGLTWGGGAAVIGTILGALAHYLMQAASASGH